MTTPYPTLRDHRLPEAVSAAFRRAAGHDHGPATLLDALDVVEELITDPGERVTLEQFRQPEPTRHAVHVDGAARDDPRTEHVPCVLDALVVAAHVDAPRVRIESTPPTGGDPVRFVVADDGADATPRDAVVSFGLSPGPTGDAGLESFESMSEVVLCSYINAFPDPDAYAAWAEGLNDGVAMAVTRDTAVSMAEAAADRWLG